MDYCLAYITAPDKELALSLARKAVESKLAACANIIDGVTSVYRWEQKTCEDDECILMLKTIDNLKPELTEMIKEHHPYDCPCIVFLPIKGGDEVFLKWVETQLV